MKMDDQDRQTGSPRTDMTIKQINIYINQSNTCHLISQTSLPLQQQKTEMGLLRIEGGGGDGEGVRGGCVST